MTREQARKKKLLRRYYFDEGPNNWRIYFLSKFRAKIGRRICVAMNGRS